MKAYTLWQEYLQHFPKKSRHSLGAKIDYLFLETMECIFLASMASREKKLPYIERGIVKFDLLKFFLQLSWSIKALDTQKYAAIAQPLNDIGKMLGGWHKNLLPRKQSHMK